MDRTIRLRTTTAVEKHVLVPTPHPAHNMRDPQNKWLGLPLWMPIQYFFRIIGFSTISRYFVKLRAVFYSRHIFLLQCIAQSLFNVQNCIIYLMSHDVPIEVRSVLKSAPNPNIGFWWTEHYRQCPQFVSSCHLWLGADWLETLAHPTQGDHLTSNRNQNIAIRCQFKQHEKRQRPNLNGSFKLTPYLE